MEKDKATNPLNGLNRHRALHVESLTPDQAVFELMDVLHGMLDNILLSDISVHMQPNSLINAADKSLVGIYSRRQLR